MPPICSTKVYRMGEKSFQVMDTSDLQNLSLIEKFYNLIYKCSDKISDWSREKVEENYWKDVK